MYKHVNLIRRDREIERKKERKKERQKQREIQLKTYFLPATIDINQISNKL
jgi:hypothetical protein